VGTVLGYFGRRKKRAIAAYENYVREGIERGRRPELVGGGLIRSLGGWSQVLSLRRRGEGMASDERILGSGDFIEQVLSEAEEKAKQMLGWKGRVADLETLLSMISKKEGVEGQKVRGGDRKEAVVGARKVFCQVAVKRLGYSGAAVLRGFWGSPRHWSIGMPVLRKWVIWINIYKLRLNLRPPFYAPFPRLGYPLIEIVSPEEVIEYE
jgi:hypothetical protein